MLQADDSAPKPKVSSAACRRAHRHAALTEAALALALIAAGCHVSRYYRGSEAAWRAKLGAADPNVRAEAAYALSVLGDTTPATIERLGRLLADTAADVRTEATAALVELGRRGGAVVPVARRAVSSPLPARTRILAATVLFPITGHAAPAPPKSAASKPAMGVTIVSVTPTTVIRKNRFVTFRLQLHVKGLVLDPRHIGKANVRGHGHVQVYVDRIPADAYVRRDPKHWLGAPLAGTTLRITVPPTLIGARGRHRLIVALAQNNSVLYRVPAAGATITVK